MVPRGVRVRVRVRVSDAAPSIHMASQRVASPKLRTFLLLVTPHEQYKIASSAHDTPGLPTTCPYYRRPVCIPT